MKYFPTIDIRQDHDGINNVAPAGQRRFAAILRLRPIRVWPSGVFSTIAQAPNDPNMSVRVTVVAYGADSKPDENPFLTVRFADITTGDGASIGNSTTLGP